MDASLVVRAQQGDRGAFAILIERVGGRLHAIAYSILRDRELAEDATQETLLCAWRDLPSLRDPDRFEAWTCRILLRICHHEAHRAPRWMSSLVALSTEPVAPNDMGIIFDRDELERGFRRLTVDQRAVVVLCYYLDLPPRQVADILRVPVGTISSRLHRALQALHAALDADARPATLPIALAERRAGEGVTR